MVRADSGDYIKVCRDLYNQHSQAFNQQVAEGSHCLILNMLRTLVGLSAVLPAVVASPYQHQKRADIDAFIEKENPIARQGILNNIGADGKLVPGAGPGIVVASPSEECMSSNEGAS